MTAGDHLVDEPAGRAPVVVEVSRDGGGTFETLAAAAPNTGSFAWVVTGPDTRPSVARVTVTDPVAASGTSGAFAIATPSLTVTGPAAGTLAYAGTPVTITWTHNLPDVDPVSIELSRDGGATFEILQAAAPNTGSFVWTASGPDTAAARVRVTSTGAVSASGVGARVPDRHAGAGGDVADRGRELGDRHGADDLLVLEQPPGGHDGSRGAERRRRRELDDARVRGARGGSLALDRDRAGDQRGDRPRHARTAACRRSATSGGVRDRQPGAGRDVARGGRELDDRDSRRRSPGPRTCCRRRR